jgi:citrate lyase subunit beta/citryl-CoA lyase
MPMRPDARTARSWLFVPGDSERKLEKCWGAGADAVIVDLEDAVSSERGMTDADLAATFECRPDGYMLPKVDTVDDIHATAAAIGRLEHAAGLAPDTVTLIPIVTEMPAPVFRLPELCAAASRSAAILWGSEDLGAAIGARRVKDAEGRMLDVFRTVRSMTLLAGSAAGLGVIDTPVIDFHNDDELAREAREAFWMGFTGKLAIHPRQVPIINAAFTPDAAEMEDAYAIAAGAAESKGAAFRLGNRMIDMPHIKAAARLVALDRTLRARRETST